MADAAHRRMTPEDFFRWQDEQDDTFELVDGVPVPRNRMMTGTDMRHDRVKVNVIVALHRPLRGSGCWPTTGAVVMRTCSATLRRPDVTVDGGPIVADSQEVGGPRLAVEIASPATVSVDQIVKLEEYKRHPALRYILLLETVAPVALLYRREAEGWQPEQFEGLEAVIDLPEIGASLALVEIYDGLTFAVRITDAMR
ncbi:Endonuclease, Uma2 family (restriction endonuclease fold) [Methylobacterium sp. 174MFSha1.1]|uniref:Uma2 family endonuclease n=1 Tax=Methylobacterium sp. 174MFSha1.1 TaxID=1502749 RepID=UPI0008EA6444|nr:Uma2 family endonuclease [Methylobacterium sp. 174MFSha1.1]SFV17463.1 Endonuclease, Uma2 family (restriction endonuclease fold) [Methylobacterium sp. 174MFSha1.1]